MPLQAAWSVSAIHSGNGWCQVRIGIHLRPFPETPAGSPKMLPDSALGSKTEIRTPPPETSRWVARHLAEVTEDGIEQ